MKNPFDDIGYADQGQQQQPMAENPFEKIGFASVAQPQEDATPVDDEPGFLSNVKNDIVGGVIDYTEMAARGARAIPGGPETYNTNPDSMLGKVVNWAEEVKKNNPQYDHNPDREGLSRWFHEATRSVTTSLAAGLPSAAAGAAVGSALPVGGTIVGGLVGYALGAGSMFGMAEYDSFMEEAKAAGIKEEDAHQYGVVSALAEGGFEAATDLMQGATFGLAGKMTTAPAKAALKKGVNELFKARFKGALGKMGTSGLIEGTAEMATSASQVTLRRKLGMTEQNAWDAAQEAFGPAFLAGVMFGGAIETGIVRNKKKVARKLMNPEVDPKLRMEAVESVAKTLEKEDPRAATMWRANGLAAIENKEAIGLEMDYIELTERIEKLKKNSKYSGTAAENLEILEAEKRRMDSQFGEEIPNERPNERLADPDEAGQLGDRIILDRNGEPVADAENAPADLKEGQLGDVVPEGERKGRVVSKDDLYADDAAGVPVDPQTGEPVANPEGMPELKNDSPLGEIIQEGERQGAITRDDQIYADDNMGQTVDPKTGQPVADAENAPAAPVDPNVSQLGDFTQTNDKGEVIPMAAVEDEGQMGEVIPGRREMSPELTQYEHKAAAVKVLDGQIATLEKTIASTKKPSKKQQKNLADLKTKRDKLAAEPTTKMTTGDRRTTDSPVLTDDRKADRRKVADMSHEEMTQALLSNELTGIPNRRAYEEATEFGASPKPVQVSIDADSLKWVNDNMTHGSGDQMLQEIATVMNEEVGEAFHISGDEFVVQGDNRADIVEKLKRAEERLTKTKIEVTLDDGTVKVLDGIGVTYAISEEGSLQQADEKLATEKQRKQDKGQRAARGEQPPNVTVTDPKGTKDQVDQVPEVANAPTELTAKDFKRTEDFETEGTYEADGFQVFRDTDQFTTPHWYVIDQEGTLHNANYNLYTKKDAVGYVNELRAKKFADEAASDTKKKKALDKILKSERADTNAPDGVHQENESIAPLFSQRSVPETIKTIEEYNKEAKVVPEPKLKKFIKDITSVASFIKKKPSLDYVASEQYSPVKPNSDAHYEFSLDFSTICKKRIIFAATMEALQKKLGRGISPKEIEALTGELRKRKITVGCGMCYVDASRTQLGLAVNRFLNYNKQFEPHREMFMTQEGMDTLAIDNPEVYLEFKKYIAAQNIKIGESRTEYTAEILDPKIISDNMIKKFNSRSGFRWQSWSDFEIIHLVDAMQAIGHMNARGISGHAYTKVPEMVKALGRTGLMMNMSLVPKGNGLVKGKLVFDNVEGLDYQEAIALRNDFSDTAGTIAVGVSDEHIRAMLADPNIDFVIPYHVSGMPVAMRKQIGIDVWEDYTETQTESVLDADKLKKKAGVDSVKAAKGKFEEIANSLDWWDYNKTGDENGQTYLNLAEEWGMVPKFPQFKNESGYWKTLIDRKMFNNEGVAIEQAAVEPNFDMNTINEMLQAYKPDSTGAVTEVVDALAEKLPAELPATEMMTGDQITMTKHDSVLSIPEADRSKAQTNTYNALVEKLQAGFVARQKVADGTKIGTLKGKEKTGYKYLFEFDKANPAFPGSFDNVGKLIDEVAAQPLMSQQSIQPTDNYAAMVETELRNELGSKVFERMQKTGKLEIVDRIAELKGVPLKAQDGQVQGFFYEGKITMIANGIERGNSANVLKHEGLHKIMAEDKIFNKKRTGILKQFESFKGKNPAVDEAFARVPQDTQEGYNLEEAFAYYMENPNNSKHPVSRKMIAAVKEFLMRIGMPVSKFTPADLSILASKRIDKAFTDGPKPPKGGKPLMSVRGIDAQQGSDSTQVATTTSMYRKALVKAKSLSRGNRVLDYGAGRGLGTDAMREDNPDMTVDSYEPLPNNWGGKQQPTYTNSDAITDSYDVILNTNVLNVLEPELRGEVINDIGNKLSPGGIAIITARGWNGDVNSAKNFEAAEEAKAIWINKTKNGKAYQVYQKGFDGNELVDYVQGVLGADFEVTKTSGLGKSSVIAKKSEQPLFSMRSTNSHLSPNLQKKFGKKQSEMTLGERYEAVRENVFTKFRQGVVDQFASLKGLSETAWMKARMSKATGGATAAAFLHGKIFMDKDGALNVDANGKGLANTLAPLGDEVDRFFHWIAGNRAEKLAGQGLENLFDDADIAEMKKLNTGTMKDGKNREEVYQKTFEEFNSFKKSILDIARESGLLSAEDTKAWDEDFYVPFYRVMEEQGDIKGPRVGSGLVKQQAFKKLKGGKDNLNDLLQNTLMNWEHLLSSSMKNNAAKESLNAATELGIAREITADEAKYNKESIFIKENGKDVHYEVSDPLILNALSAINYVGANNPAMKVARSFKRVFTMGVTAAPAFRVANLLRDTIQTMAVSDASLKGFGLDNIKNGFKATDKRGMIAAQMLASGGSMDFGYQLGGDSDAAKKFIKKIQSDGSLLMDGQPTDAFRGAVNRMWKMWEDTGNRAENVNRAALYKKLIDEGKSHFEASFAAADVLDFRQGGAWPAVRFATQIIPFLNARLQGLDKLGRAAMNKEQRGQFATVVAGYSLVAVALYMAFKDDEDFKGREDWDKDTYLWFKLPGTDKAFRIPAPFEVGAVGTMAVRLAEQMADSSAKPELFFERLGATLKHTFAFNPIPQFMNPALNVYSNKDPFTGRDIESMGMKRKSPNLRSRPNTTVLAKGMSNAMAAVGTDGTTLSPVQIEYLVQGYLGWVGASALEASDMILRPLTGAPSLPAKRLDQQPVLKRFYKEYPAAYTKYTTQFYDNLTELNTMMANINSLRKDGQGDEALKIAKANPAAMANRKTYNKVNTNIRAINNKINEIYKDKNMSRKEKRDEVQRLKQIKNDLAKKVVTERPIR